MAASLADKVVAGIDWYALFNVTVFRTVNHIGRIFLYVCAAVFLISLNGLRRLPSVT
jgi:hypothetical protein